MEGCVEVEIRDMNLVVIDVLEDFVFGCEGSDGKLFWGSSLYELVNNLKYYYNVLVYFDFSFEVREIYLKNVYIGFV